MLENKMAWQEGYAVGYAAAQEEITKLTAELDKCEEQYNKLWRYTQEKHKQITKLTAERDEMMNDLTFLMPCDVCKFSAMHPNEKPCCECDGSNWEWRGVKNERV